MGKATTALVAAMGLIVAIEGSLWAQNTPAGSNVTVSFPGDSITVVFDSVSVAGATEVQRFTASVEGVFSTEVGRLRVAEIASAVAWSVSTTATFSDSVTACVVYDEAWLFGPERDEGTWEQVGGVFLVTLDTGLVVEVTVSLDTATNTVCGRVASFPDRFHIAQRCCVQPGDINEDGEINISDIIHIVDYLFRGGLPGPCHAHADAVGDGFVSVSDLTYLVDHLFRGGPPPPPC